MANCLVCQVKPAWICVQCLHRLCRSCADLSRPNPSKIKIVICTRSYKEYSGEVLAVSRTGHVWTPFQRKYD